MTLKPCCRIAPIKKKIRRKRRILKKWIFMWCHFAQSFKSSFIECYSLSLLGRSEIEVKFKLICSESLQGRRFPHLEFFYSETFSETPMKSLVDLKRHEIPVRVVGVRCILLYLYRCLLAEFKTENIQPPLLRGV